MKPRLRPKQEGTLQKEGKACAKGLRPERAGHPKDLRKDQQLLSGVCKGKQGMGRGGSCRQEPDHSEPNKGFWFWFVLFSFSKYNGMVRDFKWSSDRIRFAF